MMVVCVNDGSCDGDDVNAGGDGDFTLCDNDGDVRDDGVGGDNGDKMIRRRK